MFGKLYFNMSESRFQRIIVSTLRHFMPWIEFVNMCDYMHQSIIFSTDHAFIRLIRVHMFYRWPYFVRLWKLFQSNLCIRPWNQECRCYSIISFLLLLLFFFNTLHRITAYYRHNMRDESNKAKRTATNLPKKNALVV